MQAKERDAATGVMRRLFAEPYRFELAQALRLLLRWLRQQNVPYDQAFSDVLRFENSLSLAFPASEIEALAWQATDGKIAVTPAVMGLLGVGGTLPLHYSERIAAYQWTSKERGASAFLDIFSHRMVTLFCQASGKYRLDYALDTRGRDERQPLLLALAGVQNEALPMGGDDGTGGAGAVTRDAAAWYAGVLRSRPVSAQAVARVLTEYCAVPVALQQFVGAWDYLPANRRSSVGGANFILGYGATLGVRLWRHDRRVRLDIGPLDPAGLQRFLPRGAGTAALAKMLALFGAPLLEYEVRLILHAACIAPLILTAGPASSAKSAQPRLLGWTTFLTTPQGRVRGAEVRYLLRLA